LSKEERLIIVDQCLEFNYKVYIVPLIADWENQKRYQKSKTIQIEDLLERKPIILDNKLISETNNRQDDFNYRSCGLNR
jgi:FlaA1/EpsC-like NDP-sugar epimerase